MPHRADVVRSDPNLMDVGTVWEWDDVMCNDVKMGREW